MFSLLPGFERYEVHSQQSGEHDSLDPFSDAKHQDKVNN